MRLPVLLLALSACAWADSGVVTPLFGWSSSAPYFASEPAGAVLEAVTDLQSLLGSLIGSALRPSGDSKGSSLLDTAALQDSAPEVVLVLLGSELRTSDLRRKHAAPLQSLIEGATSSLSLPYVMHPAEETPGGMKALHAAIKAQLPEDSSDFETAGCGEGRSLAEVAQVLEGGSVGGPRLVVGCTGVPQEQRGTQEGVAEELRQVKSAHDVVAALNKRQITLYAVHPQDDEEGAAQRRSLLSVGPYNVCDELCRTQVKWLEGMLALLLIILASLSGMCCLGVLDTPTRFESPKDSQRAE